VATDAKEFKGKFTYDRDSKRFHKCDISSVAGIVGSIYIPKDLEPFPTRIVLEIERK